MRERPALLLLVALAASACAMPGQAKVAPEELPPGRVWVCTQSSGLSVVSALGWRTFFEGDTLFDVAVDPQGMVWAAHFDGIARFDGRTFSAPDKQHRPTQIAFDGQGRLWGDSGSAMTMFDGSEWTRFEAAEVSPTLFHELVVDREGHMWAATDEGLLLFDGKTWVVQSLPSRSEFVWSLAIDEGGRLWVAHGDGASVLEGSAWTTWTLDDMGLELASIADVAIDPQGRAWLAASGSGLVLFDGQQWTLYDSANSGLVDDYVTSVAVDGQGRVWAGTSSGLSVFDGATWTTYNQSNAALGDDWVMWIVVDGGGVASLPGSQQVRVGVMKGNVLRNGQEAAGCRVMLCSSVVGTIVGYGGETPCEGPVQRETLSDAQGAFVFNDVPVGQYELAAQSPEGKWYTVLADGGLRLPKEFAVEEGKTTYAVLDVGE